MASFATHATVPVRSPFTDKMEQTNEKEEDTLKRLNGHFFSGQKQDLHPNGPGEYTFPSGTVYSGEFHEGRFHGRGSLLLPDGGRFDARWNQGQVEGGVYSFADGLEYAPFGWSYCTDADRRFWPERQHAIPYDEQPAIPSHDEEQVRNIAYDMGDCYLDPRDNKLYHYDGTYYRDPTPEELAWAKRKARIGLDHATQPTTGAAGPDAAASS